LREERVRALSQIFLAWKTLPTVSLCMSTMDARAK
jgi:hypothetical protein